MGEFNDKIEAEFNPPRKWVLERSLTYTNPNINTIGALTYINS